MAERRESVVLNLVDNFTPGMIRAAAAAALLDKNLNGLDGSQVKTTTSSSLLERQMSSTSKAMDRDGATIDKLSGRLSLLAQAASVLGPALIPIGAVAAPAITGLATAGTAAAVAGGSLIVAMQGVGDAVKAMNEQAINPSAANLEAMREAMSKLGPDAAKFVREFQAFRPVLADIRDSAAAGWFPGLIESLDDFEAIAPRVADLFERVGRAGGEMVADTAESFNSDRWTPFFDFVAAELPAALTTLGAVVGDLTHGAAEMWMAFDPANDQFLGWLKGVADGFDDWASSANGRQDIAAFLDYVNETGPQVEEFFLALVSALTQVTQAAAPLGGPVLSALTGVAKAIGAIADSDLGTPIFTGLAALSLYNRALATTAALQKSAFMTGVRGGAVGASATGALGARAAGPAAGLAGIMAVTSAQDRARLSSAALADAESKRSAAFRAGVGSSLKGAAALGGIAVAATGAADGLGISNTASLALLGTLGGPWGAAAGGAIGLTLDMAAANDKLTAAIEQAQGAMTSWDFSGMSAGFAAAQSELDAFQAKVQQSSEWDNFDIGASLAGNKDMIEGWFGDSDIEEGEKAMAALAEQMDNAQSAAADLGAAMGMTVGPLDGSAASARELDAVIAAAQPKMDGLRISVEDLATAHAVASGKASFLQVALSGGKPTYDELVGAIAGTTAAERRHADAMSAAAAAARAERAALNGATAAMREKMNAALGAFDAETRYRQALKDATEQAKKNAAGIRGSSDAAVENRNSLGGLAAAWNNQSNAVKNNVARSREARASFIDTAVAMGVPVKAAEKLANRLLEIPRKTVAKVEADTKRAEDNANRVRQLLNDVGDLNPRPDVDLLTSPFDSAYNSTKAKIRDLDGDVATVTTRMVTAYSTIGSKAAGLNPFNSADGSTVPDDGGGYRDFLDYRLAPREEVVSNRNGQADRNRPLLKGVNANLPPDRLARLVGLANGGTAGSGPWGMAPPNSGANSGDGRRSLDDQLAIAQAMQQIRELRRSLGKDGKDKLEGLNRKIADLQLKAAGKELRLAESREQREAKQSAREDARESKQSARASSKAIRDLLGGFDLGNIVPDQRPTTVAGQVGDEIARLKADIVEAGGEWTKGLTRWAKGLVAAASELDDVNTALAAETAKRDDLVKTLADQQQALDSLTSTMQSYAASVAGKFLSDPFNGSHTRTIPGATGAAMPSAELTSAEEQLAAIRASAGGDSVASAAAASRLIAQIEELKAREQTTQATEETVTGLQALRETLLADTDAANRMAAALDLLESKGLDTTGALGGLYQQLAASGDFATAEELAALSQAQIDEYEKMFEARENAASFVAAQATQAVYSVQQAELAALVAATTAAIVVSDASIVLLNQQVAILGQQVRDGATTGSQAGAHLLKHDLAEIRKAINALPRETGEQKKKDKV